MKIRNIASSLIAFSIVSFGCHSVNANEKVTSKEVQKVKPNNAISVQVYAVDRVGSTRNFSKALLKSISKSVSHSVPIDRANMWSMIKSSRGNMIAVSKDVVGEFVMNGTAIPLISTQSASFSGRPDTVTVRGSGPNKSHYDITVVPRFDGKTVKLTSSFKAVEHLKTRFVSNVFQKTVFTENGGTVWYVTAPVSMGHGKSRLYAIGLTPLILIKHMGNRAAHDLIE